MSKIDPAKVWTLNYRLLMSVSANVADDIAALGLEVKELFILAELDDHPYPAELATALLMPKATVTTNVKRLEAAGFVRREIDTADLRRHRLQLTAAGRRAMNQGVSYLSDAFGARLARLTASQQGELAAMLAKLAAEDSE